MHSTRVAMGRGMVSTYHGQRRILKYPTPDLLTYIRKAVQSGVYRSAEEIETMNKELQGNPVDPKRIRWHVPRGSKIYNYPEEYEILSLNPPEPFKPLMTVKEQRKAVNEYIQKHRPTDRLAQIYLNNNKRSTAGEPTTAEEYYRRLLGANRTPKIDSAMGAKSAKLNKAYAVAVKQYHLMRTENLSEKEALEKVEELLKQENFDEKSSSRIKAQRLKEKNLSRAMDIEERAKNAYPGAKSENEPKTAKGEQDDSSLAALYAENQRAFEGMISWTKRLQAVPYEQWTVGASVALDHWIAKRVLGLSEETWLALIEGDSPELLGRGRDIVMARHALFPETMIGEELVTQEEETENTSADDDLDAVLATLGGWDLGGDKNSDSKVDDIELAGDEILEMTTKLQEWRAKNVSTPYDDWSEEDKMSFESWLRDYVTALTPESQIGKVDMAATRKALLAAPPQSKEDSDAFWEKLSDETSAEIFLQQLLSSQRGDDDHPFWQLEYSQQLERLVSLGAIREIADEYATENDRSKFLARYGDYLLEGLEMEHLVPDPTGAISGADLGNRLAKHYKIGPKDRFRLEKIPYGTDAFGTDASRRARDIYRAWNKLKAGRAHYEEKLFKGGLLGLTYDDKDK